jgi:hypothetical protein
MARTLQLLGAGHDREDVEVRRLGSIHRLGKHARMAIKIRSFRKRSSLRISRWTRLREVASSWSRDRTFASGSAPFFRAGSEKHCLRDFCGGVGEARKLWRAAPECGFPQQRTRGDHRPNMSRFPLSTCACFSMTSPRAGAQAPLRNALSGERRRGSARSQG